MTKDNIPNANEFLVPDWLIGSAHDVEKAVQTRARAWAAAWRADRRFPAPILVAAGPLAPLLYATSDNAPEQSQARLFANANFVPQIMDVLGYRDTETLTIDYETHVGGTAWGSFEALVFERSPNGLEATRRRLERILPHLSTLSSIAVIDYDNAQRPAAVVIDRHISSTLENWDVTGDAPLAVRITTALAEIERSDSDFIQERIVASMLRLVPSAPRLHNRESLTADRLRTSLASIDPSEREELTGCTRKALLTELYAIDRE